MTTNLGAGPQFYDQDIGFAPRPDTILGEAGNDTILSSTLGGSLIDGGTDNDILQSRGAGDTVLGNDGNDSLRSLQLRTVLIGNQGRDSLSADITASLYGGKDGDFLIAVAGNNFLSGNLGDDILLGGFQGGDVLYGGQDNDQIGFVTASGQSNIGVNVSVGVGGVNQGNNYASGDLGRDTIVGINQGDSLYGGDDADSIIGVGSRNLLSGDGGNDTLRVQNPVGSIQFQTGTALVGLTQVSLVGGAGDDSLYGAIGRFGEGLNFMDGGDGNDTIRSFAIQDALYGGGGNDLITTATTNQLTTQGPISSLPGFAGQSTLDGGDGNDTLLAAFSTDILLGGTGNDSLSGSFTLLEGGDGNDTLDGSLFGTNPGQVSLFGGSGNDFIRGVTTPGVINIYDGGSGNDTIIFAGTSDSLVGTVEGNDQISAAPDLNFGVTGVSFVILDTLGNNTLVGSDGNDSIVSGSGSDFLQGGTVVAAAQTSVGFGDDTVIAGGGDDYLFGGSGKDVLIGDDGIDTLQGFIDPDTLVGGAGADIFLYQFAVEVSGTSGDFITDFKSGEDKLRFNRNPLAGGFTFELVGGVPANELGSQQFLVLDSGSYIDNGASSQAGSTPVLVYEKASGFLKYDVDGKGATPADIVAAFAKVDNSFPNLTRTDIVLF